MMQTGGGARIGAEDAADLLLVGVFAALPVAGLAAGPAYAALIFGLGAIRLAFLLARDRTAFALDRRQVLAALAFAALTFAGATWSIVPRHTLAGAAQAGVILAGTLVFLGGAAALPARTAERLATALPWAFLAGAALLAADTASGYHLQHWLGSHPLPTKYNRGVLYSLILFWPVLGGQLIRRRRRAAAGLTVAMALILGLGLSTTAQAAAVLAALTLGLARLAPRLARRLLASGTAVLALALPVLLRALEGVRPQLAPYLKTSAVHRLEIWDYMSARVMERPLLGWGLWSSEAVPIRPDELARYRFADGIGIYPHNQWLQLWVETGLAGVLLALAASLLALDRFRRLSPDMRPFAAAGFITVMAVACSDFQVTTDSWWAAIAAAALLYRTLDRMPA